MEVRPTPEQEPARWRVAEVGERVLSLAGELGLYASEPASVGALPLRPYGWRALRAPGGGMAVAVYQGTPVFFQRMAGAVACCFSPEERGEDLAFRVDEASLQGALDSETEARQGFLDALFAAAVLEDPAAAAPSLQSGARARLADLLRRSAEVFLVARGLAPILVPSWPQGASWRTVALGPGLQGEELVLAPRQALVADLVAAQLTLAQGCQEGLGVALAFWGLAFYLCCLELLEIPTVAEAGPHHLPALLRRHLLLQGLERDGGEQARGALELARAMEKVVFGLWERVKAAFLARLEAPGGS